MEEERWPLSCWLSVAISTHSARKDAVTQQWSRRFGIRPAVVGVLGVAGGKIQENASFEEPGFREISRRTSGADGRSARTGGLLDEGGRRYIIYSAGIRGGSSYGGPIETRPAATEGRWKNRDDRGGRRAREKEGEREKSRGRWMEFRYRDTGGTHRIGGRKRE